MSDDGFEYVKTETEVEKEREKVKQLETLVAAGAVEVRTLKQQLEEKEAELGESNRKLAKSEAGLEKERKKIGRLTALVSSVNLRPKRNKSTLTLPNFAKLTEQEEFFIYSHAVEAAGFQWKLMAERAKKVKDGAWLGLFLCIYPPSHYKGPFEFAIDSSFCLLNVLPGKDIKKDRTLKFKHDDSANGWGITEFAEIKKLLDQTNGFLQAMLYRTNGFLQSDGSVQAEVDFTVETSTLDHLLVDAEEDVENKKDGN